ncbi:hypothetical protein ACWGQL_01645 [Streptomyces lydicus]
MAAPMLRTTHQAVSDVRQRLDDALSRVGLDAEPSVVTVSAVEGITVNRIRIATLSLPQTIRLTQVLGGQVTRTDARAVGEELDAALEASGIKATPSVVMWNTWTAKRIIPPSLSYGQTERLVATLSGSTDDLGKKNAEENKRHASERAGKQK